MSKALFVKMALDAWNAKIKDANKVISQLSDEQLQQEISPGRNRGTYLLGHLAAVHDRMLPLLNLGERMHTELDEAYIEHPDKVKTQAETPAQLRALWNEINDVLAGHFNQLSPSAWFEKHTAVSDEAFAREPHRNRLNVLLSRTNHLASHVGQLLLLTQKKDSTEA